MTLDTYWPPTLAIAFWHALVVATLVGTTVVPLVGAAGVETADVEVGAAGTAGCTPRIGDGVLPAVVVVLAPGVVGRIQAMMPTVT